MEALILGPGYSWGSPSIILLPAQIWPWLRETGQSLLEEAYDLT